jgi:hypothetical protein
LLFEHDLFQDRHPLFGITFSAVRHCNTAPLSMRTGS